MACHHCGRARRAALKAVAAIVKGDTEEAKAAANDAIDSIKAKLNGEKDKQ